MGVISLAPRGPITEGLPSKRWALRPVNFLSTGKSSKRPVLKVTQVAVGPRPLTSARTKSSSSNSRSKTVTPVRAARCVRARLATPAVPSRYVLSRTTRRYSRHASGPRPRNSKRCILAVPGWRERFRKRVRALGLRRSRSIGQEKTPLQHLATAAAMNSVRVVRWLDGKPHAQTRRSALVQLLRPASEK